MTEESKQADRGTRESEQKDNGGGANKGFFRENPTLALTLMYVDLTGIGIFYSLIFYRQFGINIFDFAEIGDFLLAAFKSPAITFSVLLAQILLISVPLSILLLAGRVQGHWQFLILANVVAGGIGLLILSITLPLFLARYQAETIKQGEQPQVTAQYRKFSDSAGQVTKPGLELIGTTQKVVFFYDVNNKRTLVIPQAQLVSIEVPK